MVPDCQLPNYKEHPQHTTYSELNQTELTKNKKIVLVANFAEVLPVATAPNCGVGVVLVSRTIVRKI